MKVPGAISCRLALSFFCITGLFVSLHAQQNFSVQLSQGGLTSAGIFDANGRIVRTLWALETFNAGNLNCSWDGRDDLGTPVPPGSYTWTVLRNGSQYNNIGVIGNTGLPPITSGHVPSLIEGLAVDSQGNPYSVHDWDEPHFDVIRWSPVDGKSVMNSGHPICEALLKAIAVEPDGSFAYVTGYGDSLTDRTKSKFSIWRINLAPQLSESQRVVNFTQQGRSIKVYDGSAGGNPSAGYPTPEYPANATEADKDVMRVPLISIAVQGSSLYVTDAIGGRILKYDKVSGNHQSTITGVPVACGLAIASNGNIWVGHEHTQVSVYSPAGVRLATPITNLAEVRALSIQGNMLAVADRVGVVRKYTITNGTQVTLTASYGLPQRPGDRKPERLSSINGMAHGRIWKYLYFRPIGRRLAAAKNQFTARSGVAADVPGVFFFGRLWHGQSGLADLKLPEGLPGRQGCGDVDVARDRENRGHQDVFRQLRIHASRTPSDRAVGHQRFLLLSRRRFSGHLSH